MVLGEEPDRELVLGTVGQPWRLLGASGPPTPLGTMEEFIAFGRPGFAKIATNFLVEDGPTRQQCSRLRTETRVWVADRASRLRFGLYWLVIRPGSGLIRQEWLSRVRQRALDV